MCSCRPACCPMAPARPLLPCSSLPRSSWVAPMSWSSSTRTAPTELASCARSCSWASMHWPRDIRSCRSQLLKGCSTWRTPSSETWEAICNPASFLALLLHQQFLRFVPFSATLSGRRSKACNLLRVQALATRKGASKLRGSNSLGVGGQFSIGTLFGVGIFRDRALNLELRNHKRVFSSLKQEFRYLFSSQRDLGMAA
uniref:Ornithine decarboxylase antizyme n=1 Tax=Rhipicephalus zambeziensis TaxID=60191 RepID=A0A224YP01_9ACAR